MESRNLCTYSFACHLSSLCGDDSLKCRNEQIKFMGRTALHIAVQNGKVDCVKVLVSAGSSLEAKDQRGRTPIDVAKSSKNKKMMAALQPGSGVCDIV